MGSVSVAPLINLPFSFRPCQYGASCGCHSSMSRSKSHLWSGRGVDGLSLVTPSIFFQLLCFHSSLATDATRDRNRYIPAKAHRVPMKEIFQDPFPNATAFCIKTSSASIQESCVEMYFLRGNATEGADDSGALEKSCNDLLCRHRLAPSYSSTTYRGPSILTPALGASVS